MKWTIALVATVCLAATAGAAEEKDAPTSADMITVAKAIRPSLVRAEFTLKFDKGQSPKAYGHSSSGMLGRFGRGYPGYYAEGVVRQERPLEIPGFLLSDKKVIISDPMIHPRFIKSIFVRFGDQLVKASISGCGRNETAAFLTLAKPLKKAKPLAFDPKAEGPYLAAQYFRHNGDWTVQVSPISTTAILTERQKQFTTVPLTSLIVDGKGKPVGMAMNGYLPTDNSWKRSPVKWPIVPAKEIARRLAGLDSAVTKGLLRVKLSFRSPKKGGSMGRLMGRGGDESSTERNVIGVLIKKTEVLVLAHMKPNVTARLERIAVHPAKGKAVAAKFAHTLADYGAFLAKLEKPLPGALALSSKNILNIEDRLLLAADVTLQGEKREAYFAHRRVGQFQIGWKRHVYPGISGGDDHTFLFDDNGALLALPVSRREKVTVTERWGGGGSPALTATMYLNQVFADLAKNVDPSNVPLSEAEESRLAWMGVELQGLNRELARMNKVSHLTNDGRSGALVSYVYANSPAQKAGIEPGYILIRLDVVGHPKPLEVKVRDFGFGGRAFPWDRLDNLPERFFDQIPRPWPPAENSFTRALTELGFGKKYTAVFFSDGKLIRKDFAVVQSPPHYDSARRHKDKKLGMTVRDMTYELRRYFQKTKDDPGVILSKIEPGSKASVSGLRPYEIITHVNDKPVKNVKDFASLIKDQEELRLTVKRMTQGRLVKIKMAPGDKPAGPATKPATKPAAPEATKP